MNDNILKIAIIGNPNQGKTSLVANLAYNDSLKISKKSGETQKSAKSSLLIDNEVIYELYDTPGFHNTEDIRDDLLESSSQDINSILRKCIEEKKNDSRFALDIEILEVLIKSDIIIYVVDCSEYSAASKPALDIIKIMNKPSFIIFNNKEEIHKNDSWNDIIDNYFLSSYNYNVLNSNFDDKLNIFKLFKAHIKDKNILNRLDIAINKQEEEYSYKAEDAFYNLGESLYKIMNYSKTYSFSFLKNFNDDSIKRDILDDILKLEEEFYNHTKIRWGFGEVGYYVERKDFDILTIPTHSIFGLNVGLITLLIFIITTISFLGLGYFLSVIFAIIFSFLGNILMKQYNGPGKKTNITFLFSDIKYFQDLFARMYIFILFVSQKNYADKMIDITIRQEDYNLDLFDKKLLEDLEILFKIDNRDEFIKKIQEISERL